jgi:hypothetical protein
MNRGWSSPAGTVRTQGFRLLRRLTPAMQLVEVQR